MEVQGVRASAAATATASGTMARGFEPYANNGGTIVAIAGEDFCVVAADTRQSNGYSINTRYAPKAFALTDRCVLASSGFYGDIIQLNKRLKIRIEQYFHQHNKQISTPALAQMLSNTLYYKRFFPYYSFNIVGGLDEQGRGAVFHFDVVGSFQRERYRADGTAQELIQPLLDNQVGLKNQLNPDVTPISLDKAIKLVRDAFNVATERDIYTGDAVEIHIITRDGIRVEKHELRKD